MRELPGLSCCPLAGIEISEDIGLRKESGKVRESFVGDGIRFLVATDRLSAFDRNIGLIPGRGQILTGLSAWWFAQTEDIVRNHMIKVIDPNVMAVDEYRRVDLEMVVRGFNTGSTGTSIWMRYVAGQREFGGVTLGEGMRKNENLPRPVVDPTNKASVGHDEPMTRDEIVSKVMAKEKYSELEQISLSLFARGQKLAAESGLILVDTKYEFGVDPVSDEFVLIDEIHTPDSSRFWGLDSYRARFLVGDEPEIYDKEFVRLWMREQGYSGEGDPPVLPREIVDEIRRRYAYAYEGFTGERFVQVGGDRQGEIIKAIKQWLSH